MRTTTLRALLRAVPLLALLPLLAASEAHAQPKKEAPAAPAPASKSEEASQSFKSGVAFYKDRDFTAALVEFKRAYELLPNYNVLFNLGQTARELKDYAAALTAFERYLDEGGAKVSAARRKEVQTAIDELKKKVSKIKVTINVDGAEVLVDDVAVGVSPLAQPVVVNVGRRKLSATSSGYTPAQRMVDVAGTAETEVTLELAKIGSTAPPPIEPPPAPPKPGTPVGAWVALSATGASAIATGVMGGLAVSAHGDLKSALAKYPGDAKAIADAQSKTRTFALTTDVLTGITAAGAVTTAVLFVLAPKASEKAPPPATTVGVSPMGIVVRGVF